MNIQEQVATRFREDIASHRITIRLSDGIYRHIVARQPGTSAYWFEIITTPGQLTINGDMGTYVFARLDDMFDFFGSKPAINPQYWGEKLRAHSGYRRHSPEKATQIAREVFQEKLEDNGFEEGEQETEMAWHVFDEDVLSQAGSPDLFHEALESFDAVPHIKFQDTWEWDFEDYIYQYLWCLHAIVWAINEYRQAEAEQVAMNVEMQESIDAEADRH